MHARAHTHTHARSTGRCSWFHCYYSKCIQQEEEKLSSYGRQKRGRRRWRKVSRDGVPWNNLEGWGQPATGDQTPVMHFKVWEEGPDDTIGEPLTDRLAKTCYQSSNDRHSCTCRWVVLIITCRCILCTWNGRREGMVCIGDGGGGGWWLFVGLSLTLPTSIVSCYLFSFVAATFCD